MTIDINASLIFCEGAHDVIFVRKLLKLLMNYQDQNIKFSELPSPFNSLFKKSVEKHAADDLSLNMAHKFFLPDFILKKDDKFVCVFNTGGQGNINKIKNFLSDFIPLFENARIFPSNAENICSTIKYLFIYDADELGIEGRVCEFSKHFNDIEFNTSDWQYTSSDFARISSNKAIYVWGESSQRGTLEDILVSVFQHRETDISTMDISKEAMSNLYSIDPEIPLSVSRRAKYNKAVMTTAGQKDKPGQALSTIIKETNFVSSDSLTSNERVSDFVSFIRSFIETH
jgi:hypothetical protein